MKQNSLKTEQVRDPELRFAFGRNWDRFLNSLNEQRIEKAQSSLLEFWLKDKKTVSFLDIGSGSGTFSLAAKRLGANVHSFDYDEFSVACTQKLKQLHFSEDDHWKIEQGSVLNKKYVGSLGAFDIVYSWGVLHHTGAMWQALENATLPVAKNGLLVIAIYNDQGWKSRFWKIVKRIYCSNVLGKFLITAIFVPLFLAAFFVADVIKFRSPFARYRDTHEARGMSVVTDIIDWIGGYPFEVATADEIIMFYRKQGFRLEQKKLTTGLGCNEFVFVKSNVT